jgi:hypothetical protein
LIAVSKVIITIIIIIIIINMAANGALRDEAKRLQGVLYFQNGMRLHGKCVDVILFNPKSFGLPPTYFTTRYFTLI